MWFTLKQILYIINYIVDNIFDSLVLPDDSVNILKRLFSFSVTIRTCLLIVNLKYITIVKHTLQFPRFQFFYIGRT